MNEYSPSFSVITGFPQIVTVSPPHIKFPGFALTFQTMRRGLLFLRRRAIGARVLCPTGRARRYDGDEFFSREARLAHYDVAHEARGASSVFARRRGSRRHAAPPLFFAVLRLFREEHGAAAVRHYFVAARFVEASREVFAARGLHGERGFVSVSPYGGRRHACGDWRLRKSAYAAQRVLDCAAFHRELFFIGNVLELAAAAASEERATRLCAPPERRRRGSEPSRRRNFFFFVTRRTSALSPGSAPGTKRTNPSSPTRTDALAFVVESRYRYVKYISLSHV